MATDVRKLQRQAERRAQHIVGLQDKNDSLRHEVRRLEDVLAWVYRTGASPEKVREVVGRTIPQRIVRDNRRRALNELTRLSEELPGGYS